MINLKNKYCLVTGCNGHIGYAITKKLKGLGAKVIGVDLESKKKNPNLSLFIEINLDHKTEIDKLIKTNFVFKKKITKNSVLIKNNFYK